MNPGGAVEEGAKVATGIVDSLKSSPVLLALVIFNALFVGVVYFASADNKERQAKLIEHLLENQQAILQRCGPAQAARIIPLPPVRPPVVPQ